MIIYISLIIVVCVIAYITDNYRIKYYFNINNKKVSVKSRRRGFGIVFLILSIFSALRDGIGIDYISYCWHIENIQDGRTNYMEVGFRYLVELMKNISDNPRLVIIICGVATCYFFLRAIYDQSEDVVMSVYLFMTFGYYFLSFNTIRNYLAMAMVLFSMKYLKQKRHIKFLLFVVFASCFHKSAIICIPLYYLAQIKFKRVHYLMMSAIPFVAFIFKNQIRMVYFMIYPSYENTRYDDGAISWLNVLKGLLILVVGLIYYKKINEKSELLSCFNLNIFALIFYIGFPWTPEISRIGFYMNISMILFIPSLIKQISDSQSRNILRIAMLSAGFVLFSLLARGWYDSGIKLLPYETWLTSGF